MGRRRDEGMLLPAVAALLCSPSLAALLRPLTNGSCEVGWFPCGGQSGLCLEQRFFCNHVNDCPSGLDEHDCLDDKGDTTLLKKVLSRPLHLWENRYKCSLAQYPPECHCQLKTRVDCTNLQLRAVPQDIDSRVTTLALGNNTITLTADSLNRYPRLTIMHLQNNSLKSIPTGTFAAVPNLAMLFLNYNELSTRGAAGALEGLRSLRSIDLLDLSHNSALELDEVVTLARGPHFLFMNHNQETLQGRKCFLLLPVSVMMFRPRRSYVDVVCILFLEDNLVEQLTVTTLRGFTALEALYLRRNRIRVIIGGAFVNQPRLLDLELNFNKITFIAQDAFRGLKSLVNLNLKGNPLLVMESGTLKQLSALDSLRLADMELSSDLLYNISKDITRSPHTPNVTHVYFKRFRYCSSVPVILDCWPKTDGVSSFEHLLGHERLRVVVWLVAMATLVGNLTVLGGRCCIGDDNKVLSLFIRNLAVADLMTGLYLVVVAAKDVLFRARYNEHAYYWMASWQCTATGILAMTSTEVSVLILSFMSVERWLCISWPLRAPRVSLPLAKVTLVFMWVVGFALAVGPVLLYRGHQGFYGTNGLCFPLHLDDPWVPGWPYSAALFLGLNQLGVVVILVAYACMFASIRHTRANTPLSLDDREWAMRFFFIVFTNCMCWVPIIILRILALADVEIKPVMYPYVVVLLLPINSAINPFLYTFTTTKFRTQARRFLLARGTCPWAARRDSESEAMKTFFSRSLTPKFHNGRSVVVVQRHSSPRHSAEVQVPDDSKLSQGQRYGAVADTPV
ncbi:relaxin receptor 2-like [Eriocheir sinensis]|uniref:relaxin receptor 2-like n=1 Tax=Eriocheir sinensis TaxID=95602 RepID=UPI0021C58FAD|nr:relaxin receptor 2-like [Eriocheir sinensis]